VIIYITFACSFGKLGDRYIVVDSGGGTVDMTVHQIRLPEGHLKELYKATGRWHFHYLHLYNILVCL